MNSLQARHQDRETLSQCTILYRIPLAIGVGFHWYEPGIPVLSKLRRTLRSSQRMRWRSGRDRMLARVEATIALRTPAIVRSCARALAVFMRGAREQPHRGGSAHC